MKLHTTIKQLSGLGKKGKIKLRKWWKPTEGDWFLPGGGNHKPNMPTLLVDITGFTVAYDKTLTLPLLSIGQLIEFLDENRERSFVYDVGDGKTLRLCVSWAMDSELIDILWEAVKEVLEE